MAKRKYRRQMFTVFEAAAWAERNGFDGSTAEARTAMEDAATLSPMRRGGKPRDGVDEWARKRSSGNTLFRGMEE